MRWRAGASQVITTAVVVVAIVGGQWTLWWHIQRDRESSEGIASASPSESDLRTRDSVSLELGDLGDSRFTVPEQFEPPVGTNGAEADEFRDDVEYFPEAVRSRAAKNAVARAGVAVLKAAGGLQTAGGAEAPGSGDEAPETLTPPANAAPIEADGSSLEAIIRKELPNATAQELQIWAEEMEGLPPESVREILQLRKRLGGAQSLIPSIPSWILEPPGLARVEDAPGPESSEPDGVAVLDGFAGGRIEPTLAALRLARDVIVNNLANAETVAFKRSMVDFEDLSYEKLILSDSEGEVEQGSVLVGLGIRIAGTPVDHAQGPLLKTGRPLTVAIDGRGFLQVTDGNVRYYTRAGTLTIDAESQLAFASADRVLPLVPTITIPEGAYDLEIGENGTVSVRQAGQETRQTIGTIELCRFVNPPALERVGGNLFVSTVASGPPVPGPAETEGRGRLEQGYLEQSNVDPAKEESVLKLIDGHIASVLRAAEEARPASARAPFREAARR